MLGFFGMRGTGDWETDQRPKSWREQILYLYPNGDLPLTALLSKANTEVVDDPEFNWWDETVDLAAGTITGVYTDSGLSTAYVSGGAAGDTLYIKMSATDVALVHVGHQVLLRDASNLDVDVVGKVTARVANGTSSYMAVYLLEADNNSVSNDLSDADTFMVVGSVFEEGASMPRATSFAPVKHSNYTQIFRTPLEITGTALETKLRTNPQAYEKLRAQTLERHGIEMEGAFWFGIPTEGTGSGGKPVRTTGGVLHWIKSNTYAAANNISNYSTADAGFDGSYNSKTWIAAGGGIDWLNEMLERIFRYGGGERIAFCGPGAMLGIQRLISAHGTIQLQPVNKGTYGMSFQAWTTPFGTVYLKTHPLWRNQAAQRNMMVLLEPSNLTYRPLKNRDTKFFDDKNGNNAGDRRVDGKNEEFLTEAGLEFHHPETCGILTGVGKDNA